MKTIKEIEDEINRVIGANTEHDALVILRARLSSAIYQYEVEKESHLKLFNYYNAKNPDEMMEYLQT